MKKQLESNRIWIFLLFAFGLAWLLDLVIYLSGGLTGLGIGNPAWILMTVSMTTPALANILTRLVTKEGWQDLWLRPNLKHGRHFWVLAWLGTPVLILLGTGLFFALSPQFYDPTFSILRKLLEQVSLQTGKPAPFTPGMLIIVQIIQAILFAPIINSLAVLGEEFGWRAYLLPKLLPLGVRKAILVMGVIWGIWHWPVILMGYEFGLTYPGAPWLGLMVMLWFTFITGTILGWLTLNSRSVWPAVIAHGSINGIAVLGTYLVQGKPNPLFGPATVGLVPSLPFAILAFLLLWRSAIFSTKNATFNQVEVPLQGKI